MRTMLVVLMALCLISSFAVAKEPTKPVMGSRGLLDCSGAVAIQCGATVAVDNTNAPNNVETYGCVGWTESGGEVVFTLDIAVTTELTVTLSNGTCDFDAFILASCEEADCVNYVDTTRTFTVEPGTYYIVVDGYNGCFGTVDLTVECVEAGEDPDCLNADEAVEYLNSSPGAPHWYHFTAPIDGCIWINTCLEGQLVDTRVYVYSDCFLTQIGYSDDIYGDCAYYNYASFVDVPVSAGDDLYIFFDPYWSTAPFDWELLVTDCVIANEDQTWGAVKSLYQ